MTEVVLRQRVRPVAIVVQPTPVLRERVRPAPSTPHVWPNGSAVFESGAAKGGTWVPAEQRPGFQGRVVREDKGRFKVWRWRGQYQAVGVFASFSEALAKL